MNEAPSGKRDIEFKYEPSPIEPQRLRQISAAHVLLESPTRKESWLNLSSQVEPWETGVELSDNIRNVVTHYVETKIPRIKERVPRFAQLTDSSLVNALTNNWFEEVEQIGGKRSEVLLTVMAHVVKRIETHTYKEVLQHAGDDQLEALGLNPNLRDLTISLLDIAPTADPLFIRFKAMSHLTGELDEAATKTTFFLPDNKNPYTSPTLFPKENLFLAERFKKLVEKPAPWQQEQGGELFKEYIAELGKLYAEHDVRKAETQQETVENLYNKLLQAEFPITFTPATGGYMKEPYLDPELKVSLH